MAVEVRGGATFERSIAGQQNRALFFNVDRVIYVEGGRDTGSSVESFDGMFWRKLFRAVRPDLRIRTIPKGSKSNVLSVAASLGLTSGSRVIAAIDRDYDDFLKYGPEHPAILKTYGYSFENDAFSPDALATIFYDICPICEVDENIEQIVHNVVEKFKTSSWWGHLADICGVSAAQKIIDREAPQKYIRQAAVTGIPEINRSAFYENVKAANKLKSRNAISRGLKQSDIPRFSVGHLYGEFCFRLMIHLHARFSKTKKLTKTAVTSAAIQTLYANLMTHSDEPVLLYYRKLLSVV